MNMIVCCNMFGYIGKDGDLMYHMPEDMKRFKKLTMGEKYKYGDTLTYNQCLMGRKTFESLPKPLENRMNIIFTNNEELLQKDTEDNIVYIDKLSFDYVNAYSSFGKNTWIIGGAEIYKQMMPYVNKIYLTLVDDYKIGDKLIDLEYIYNNFERVNISEVKKYNGLEYKFIDLVRKDIDK